MMNALGYQDYFRGHGCQGGAPMCSGQKGMASTPAQGGSNVVQGSFSYSSSVEVSFSSDAMQMAYSSKTEVSFTYSRAAEIARPAPAQAIQSPEDSAANILNFIEERLKSLKAGGASVEDMQKALDDGLGGYQTGRDQAIDILKGYGMYEGPIKSGVEKTTALVEKGIDELGKKYLGAATAVPESAAPVQPAKQVAVPAAVSSTPAKPVSVPSDDDEQATAVPSVSRYRAKLYNEDTLDMTVKTRDGDTVTISISALQALRVNGADWTGMTGFAGLQGDGSLSTFKGMYSESMLFEVDGELDDAEKAALDELIASVMDLADSFYGGDMAAALDKASQLALDPAELSSMALEMTQTRYMRASAATYRDIAGFGGRGESGVSAPQASQRGRDFDGLGDYVRNLRDLGNRAGNLMNPKDFINELFSAAFAQMDVARKSSPLGLERIDALHRGLVDGALKNEPAQAAA